MLPVRFCLRRLSQHALAKSHARYPSSPVSALQTESPDALHKTPAQSSALSLVRVVRHCLRRGQSSIALNQVRKALYDDFLHYNSSRARLFELTANAFLLYRDWAAAAQVYHWMVSEGFIPSPTLRTKITVLDTLVRSRSEQDFYSGLHRAFAKSDFDEGCLRTVLRVLTVGLECPPSVINRVVAGYVSCKTGFFDLSVETKLLIRRLRMRTTPLSLDLETKRAAILLDRISPPMDQHLLEKFTKIGVDYLLQTLQPWISSGAGVNVCNALIAAHLNACRYDRAFQIYNLLLLHDHSQYELVPDEITYRLLFQAIRKYRNQKAWRHRRSKLPRSAPSPRQLFRDLLIFTNTARAQRLSSGTLVTALETFTALEDYSAAYVVLKTFSVLKRPLPLYAYSVVLKHIMLRMQQELPRLQNIDRQRYWTYRFLGSPSDCDIHLDISLLYRILEFGAQPQLTLSIPTEKSVSHKHKVPHPDEIVSIEQVGNRFSDPIPLERILRRAILASYPEVFVTPARKVSIEINEAKAELLPDRSTDHRSDP
ncbi:hypothetical protein K474DRAFT_1664288 [Panus rudis PR-1116 ss-1]|nr:hypothetical protein K474DRAFT_1664288 [Panus rudis PR-1116 ss-1]